MKERAFTVCVLAVSLTFALAWAVAAQVSQPFAALQRNGPPPQPTPAWWDWDGGKAFQQPFAPAGMVTQAVNPSALTLSQPVLGFRYAQTFGETEVPYFDDPQHLNTPSGVGTDGTNVWVVECLGRRALKYTSDGTFVMKIGKAGFSEFAGATLACLADVAVDGSGNIWVVDPCAQHVVKFNSSGSCVSELGVTWNSGTGNDHFNQPYSIAFDSAGNIYISDSGNHRIQVFNSNGVYSTTIGVTGAPGSDNAHFNNPRHIAIDSNSRLYVADANNHRAQLFNVSNVAAITYVATIGVSGESGSDNAHFSSPEGVAVDVTRGRIYVADAANGRVQVFDYATREYQTTLTGFDHTTADVAVDSAGNLYVVEPWPHRVRQFDNNLNYVRTYGTIGVPYLTDGSHYNRPAGVAVAPDGSIYISEAAGQRLIKLNTAGVPQWIIGEAGIWGSDNEHFGGGWDVALDAAGRVYIADSGSCRIQIYNPDGSYYATLGTGCGSGDYQFWWVPGLTIAPNGDIYVADHSNHRVQVFNSDRVYVATIGETGVAGSDNVHFNHPRDVEVDSAGNIYVVDTDNHRVQIFDSKRVYVRTLGETGVARDDFAHLSSPVAVTVDAAGRIYVGDQWGSRVQVFNSSGAYLTTVGGSSGSRTGQLRNAADLVVDATGNLYIAENENHCIQKFAPQTFTITNTNTYGRIPDGGFAYTYTLALTEFHGRPTTLSLDLSPEPTWPFTTSLSAASVNLPAQGTVTVTAWVTIPSAAILPTTWLSQTTFTVTFSDLTTGAPLTETLLRAAVPLPERNPPRTLLNADDVARMKSWAATHSWVASLRDQIVSTANAWPAKYLSDYNLTSPDLPPDGGYPDDWYICPDGTPLHYVPTHSPPHYCPSTGQYYASPPQWLNRPALYDQVIYQRRHFDLAQYAKFLGLAYQLTGNTAYANNAAYILRAYSAAYLTYPLHVDYLQPTWWQSAARATSTTLDEARWLIDLAWAYDLITGSGALTSADHTAIANGLLRPAVTVIAGNNHGMSNWQVWHNAAMAITGLALDDPRPVADTFYNSDNGFFAHLAQGAAADGFWWEGSWSYHFATLNPLFFMAEMGVRAGLDPYADPSLRAMLTVPLQMAAPDLTLPIFNDDTGYPLATGWDNWVYEIGYNRYRDPNMVFPLSRIERPWQALLWGVESLPTSSTSVQTTSALLPKAGYAVLRAGSSDALRYLAFDFGPHGGWHGHYDKLGYVSYALGKTLGTDPGTHSYVSALHDGWDRTTVAHNAVVVDEQNQLEATGNLHRYLGLPALSLATADAGPVYPNRAAITRTLVLNADYWLDVARATSLDGNLHRYDWVYHNPGVLSTPLSLTPYTAFTTTNGYDYLTNTQATTTGTDWQATWDLSGVGQPYGYVFRSSDSIRASFTITDRLASSGSLSGQLDYDFGTITEGWLLYGTPVLYGVPTEVPTHFDVRVYGDGSNNPLTLKIEDATGEGFGKWATNITWTGWRTVELPVDNTWWHGGGNNDGVIDPPVRLIFLQLGPGIGAARSGRLFADDMALTFPLAGKQIVEDFEGVRVRVQMAGVPDTTVAIGDGIDWSNRPIPFAMARRQAIDTTFVAVFEPYRQFPRITAIEALSVTPAIGSRSAFRIGAAGLFTDTLLLVDKDTLGDRTFGNFTTDGAVAYLRQDTANNLQTLVLGNATKLADGPFSLFTSTIPITIQVVYASDVVFLTLPTIPVAQLRLYAPTARGVLVNNIPTPVQRDGQYLLIALPPNPIYRYLPLVLKNNFNP
jgi:DNA-binding beta-propeller fold protein YncE